MLMFGVVFRGGAKGGNWEGAMAPVLGFPLLCPQSSFRDSGSSRNVELLRDAALLIISLDSINSNLLQLQLRNYPTLCELIRDNRAKLLKDGYCSTVAYHTVWFILC